MRIAAALMGVILVGATAWAQPSAPAGETRAAFMLRCKRETIAKWPDVRAQAESICQSNWELVTATFPIADAILAAAPPAGTAFEPNAAKARTTGVRWAARPQKGQAASGAVGGAAFSLGRAGAAVSWFKHGEPSPYLFDEALRARGAAVTMLACLSYGAAESTTYQRVVAPGKAPFILMIARREAAVASQSSEVNVEANFVGAAPTLAALRRQGDDWQARCPD